MNVGKIYSILGNPNSLVPLAVKDFSATGGMTAGSFVTGKEEGQDRFIDEMGTEIIWLFGIPFFKWLYDKTVFKMLGLDSKFDVRNLENKKIFEKIQEYAPNDKIKNNLIKIAKKQKSFKHAAMGKFIISTGLTVGTYIGLTKTKQKYTENKIRQNLIEEYNSKKHANKNKTEQNGQTSFKGSIGEGIKSLAFSPVKNMWILDGCITGERLKDSRSTQEFIGYGIKEASTLCFMYYAGGKIQDLLEKRANEKHQRCIGLDARVIEDGSVQKCFEDKSILKSISQFKKACSSDEALYEFIHSHPDNEIIKIAKKSDLIQLYKEPKKWYELFKKAKETEKIDTRKYIDLKNLKDINKNLEILFNQYNKAINNGNSSEKFFEGVKKFKRNSIRMNIGTCIFALGIFTPGIMLAKRFLAKSDVEFKTKTEVRQKLIEEGVIGSTD